MLSKFRVFWRGSTRQLSINQVDLLAMQANLPSCSSTIQSAIQDDNVNNKNTVINDRKSSSAEYSKSVNEALSKPTKFCDQDDELLEELHNDPVFRAYFYI